MGTKTTANNSQLDIPVKNNVTHCSSGEKGPPGTSPESGSKETRTTKTKRNVQLQNLKFEADLGFAKLEKRLELLTLDAASTELDKNLHLVEPQISPGESQDVKEVVRLPTEKSCKENLLPDSWEDETALANTKSHGKQVAQEYNAKVAQNVKTQNEACYSEGKAGKSWSVTDKPIFDEKKTDVSRAFTYRQKVWDAWQGLWHETSSKNIPHSKGTLPQTTQPNTLDKKVLQNDEKEVETNIRKWKLTPRTHPNSTAATSNATNRNVRTTTKGIHQCEGDSQVPQKDEAHLHSEEERAIQRIENNRIGRLNEDLAKPGVETRPEASNGSRNFTAGIRTVTETKPSKGNHLHNLQGSASFTAKTDNLACSSRVRGMQEPSRRIGLAPRFRGRGSYNYSSIVSRGRVGRGGESSSRGFMSASEDNPGNISMLYPSKELSKNGKYKASVRQKQPVPVVPNATAKNSDKTLLPAGSVGGPAEGSINYEEPLMVLHAKQQGSNNKVLPSGQSRDISEGTYQGKIYSEFAEKWKEGATNEPPLKDFFSIDDLPQLLGEERQETEKVANRPEKWSLSEGSQLVEENNIQFINLADLGVEVASGYSNLATFEAGGSVTPVMENRADDIIVPSHPNREEEHENLISSFDKKQSAAHVLEDEVESQRSKSTIEALPELCNIAYRHSNSAAASPRDLYFLYENKGDMQGIVMPNISSKGREVRKDGYLAALKEEDYTSSEPHSAENLSFLGKDDTIMFSKYLGGHPSTSVGSFLQKSYVQDDGAQLNADSSKLQLENSEGPDNYLAKSPKALEKSNSNQSCDTETHSSRLSRASIETNGELSRDLATLLESRSSKSISRQENFGDTMLHPAMRGTDVNQDSLQFHSLSDGSEFVLNTREYLQQHKGGGYSEPEDLDFYSMGSKFSGESNKEQRYRLSEAPDYMQEYSSTMNEILKWKPLPCESTIFESGENMSDTASFSGETKGILPGSVHLRSGPHTKAQLFYENIGNDPYIKANAVNPPLKGSTIPMCEEVGRKTSINAINPSESAYSKRFNNLDSSMQPIQQTPFYNPSFKAEIKGSAMHSRSKDIPFRLSEQELLKGSSGTRRMHHGKSENGRNLSSGLAKFGFFPDYPLASGIDKKQFRNDSLFKDPLGAFQSGKKLPNKLLPDSVARNEPENFTKKLYHPKKHDDNDIDHEFHCHRKHDGKCDAAYECCNNDKHSLKPVLATLKEGELDEGQPKIQSEHHYLCSINRQGSTKPSIAGAKSCQKICFGISSALEIPIEELEEEKKHAYFVPFERGKKADFIKKPHGKITVIRDSISRKKVILKDLEEFETCANGSESGTDVSEFRSGSSESKNDFHAQDMLTLRKTGEAPTVGNMEGEEMREVQRGSRKIEGSKASRDSRRALSVGKPVETRQVDEEVREANDKKLESTEGSGSYLQNELTEVLQKAPLTVLRARDSLPQACSSSSNAQARKSEASGSMPASHEPHQSFHGHDEDASFPHVFSDGKTENIDASQKPELQGGKKAMPNSVVQISKEPTGSPNWLHGSNSKKQRKAAALSGSKHGNSTAFQRHFGLSPSLRKTGNHKLSLKLVNHGKNNAIIRVFNEEKQAMHSLLQMLEKRIHELSSLNGPTLTTFYASKLISETDIRQLLERSKHLKGATFKSPGNNREKGLISDERSHWNVASIRREIGCIMSLVHAMNSLDDKTEKEESPNLTEGVNLQESFQGNVSLFDEEAEEKPYAIEVENCSSPSRRKNWDADIGKAVNGAAEGYSIRRLPFFSPKQGEVSHPHGENANGAISCNRKGPTLTSLCLFPAQSSALETPSLQCIANDKELVDMFKRVKQLFFQIKSDSNDLIYEGAGVKFDISDVAKIFSLNHHLDTQGSLQEDIRILSNFQQALHTAFSI